MTIHDLVAPPDAVAPPRGERWSLPFYFLVVLAASIAVIGFDLLDGIPFAQDVDDVLRELQIRRLVDGASWFDLSLPAVQMPETYILPWSRLVDLPYALIAWGLEPVMGREPALAFAFRAWPPVLGAVYLLTLLGCLRRLVPRASELPVAILVMLPVFAIYSIWEFSPGRIDHHNVQIVLLALIACGVLRWDRRGGIMVGAASSLSLAVGLETLPVLVAVLGGLTLAWLLDERGSRAMLRSTGAACAGMAFLLAAALIAPSRYLVAVNDSFSAPYAAAVIGFGLIALAWTGEPSGTSSRARRSASFIGANLLLIAVIAWTWPGLLDGPMPMLKGLAKTYWFDRINFEQGVFSLFSTRDMRALLQYFAVFAVLAAAVPSVGRAMRRGEPALPILFVATLTAVAMACMSLRFLRIALSLVVVLLPIAVLYFRAEKQRAAGRGLVLGSLAVLAMLAAGRMYVFPPEPVRYDAFDHVVRGDCGKVSSTALHGVTAGRIMTTPRLGIELAATHPAGISVSAIPFHRASGAMSDTIAVLMGRTAAENAERLAGFDYLAICRIPAGLPNEDQLPLLRDLQAGIVVPGLESLGAGGSIMIFRIDHAALN
ncbi:MAG: hypothetical protein KL863_06470 [Rhizobium sp.]|nr:hypothetical protein [Rhizobium sp.]